MANQICDYGAEQWMAMLFGAVALPSSYWLAIANDEPGTDIDGTMLADLEPTDPAYARVEVSADAEHWGIVANGMVANLLEVDFPTPTEDWGDASYLVLCSAQVGGDLYAYSEFADPQSVGVGYLVGFPAGVISIRGVSLEPSISS